MVVAAVHAEAVTPGASAAEAVVVGVVGAAFLVSATAARGPTAMRALVAAVGVAWLLASFLPATVIVHQAVLAVALVAFPTGLIRGPGRWVLVALAVPVGLALVPQPTVAALFAVIALTAALRLRGDPVAGAFPTVAATAVATVLGGSWAISRLASDVFNAGVALLAYELVLLTVATGFVVAARAVVADRTRLADRLLGDAGATGTAALTGLLAATLRDPSLRVLRHGEGAPDDAEDREPAGAADQSSRVVPPRKRLEVRDGSRLLAVVLHRAPALDDAPTAAAAAEAVRLVLLNEQRGRELAHRAEALRASRARVVAATDRQRAVTAARLRAEVVHPLERTLSSLRDGHIGSPTAPEPVAVAAGEIAAAVEDIDALAAGVPPVPLGGGRLGPALEQLARRVSVQTEVSVAAGCAGTPEQEGALFYVCTEALTNVVKHADASSVGVVLTSDGSGLSLRVSDDGRGGADAAGSGLRGLADRLQVVGGRLRVESPPGAGTTVRASVPG
jgi:signal transduction histidine kinase